MSVIIQITYLPSLNICNMFVFLQQIQYDLQSDGLLKNPCYQINFLRGNHELKYENKT